MQRLMIIISGLVLLMGFQNCGQVDFKSPQNSEVHKISSDGLGEEEMIESSVDADAIVDCGQNINKILICHVPPGNPSAKHTICIGTSAVPAHIDHHEDYQGACDDGEGGISASSQPFMPGN